MNKNDIGLIKLSAGKDTNIRWKEVHYIPADGMMGW
jgi:hypothetical protein